MKTALLLIAHGSPREDSNQDILSILEIVRLRNAFDEVAVAYLDCNTPDIAEAVEKLAADRVTRITAVPYFLHEGRHTAVDVPSELEKASNCFRTIEFLLGNYVGAHRAVTGVLSRRAREAMEQNRSTSPQK